MAEIALVEPYYSGSHRAWADSWMAHSRHDIALISHPGEFWRWRLRGAAVTLAEAFDEHLGSRGAPDAVVVSGLVDVAAFAGHARRSLGETPIAVYVHESQLLYPLAPNQRPDTSLALINWQSLVVADGVWFNSAFHRDALHAALPGFLRGQPTPSHAHLVDSVFAKSSVLWPGVDVATLINASRTKRAVPRVLWNQRWDHDKNPHAVFSALAALADEGIAFTLSLAGQNLQTEDPEGAWVRDRLADRIDHSGFLPADDYRRLLLESDVVVSAADHEFFGIALVEAVAAGAVPVLPDRLSFPELIDSRWRETVLYPDGELRARLRNVLSTWPDTQARVHGLRESMGRFDVRHAAQAHDDAVDQLIG